MFTDQTWYDDAMRLSLWQHLLAGSVTDIMDAFDQRPVVRQRPQAAGSATKAWNATGSYVRGALAAYGHHQSQSHHAR